MNEPHQDVAGELLAMGVRTAPGAVMSAITLNNVVMLLTAVFITVQIGYLLWKWRREWNHAQRNRKAAALAEKRLAEK